MPKAYWVVTYRSVENPEARKAYAKLAVPAIESSGGRFLARSNPAKTYEAGRNQRVVLVEFDSLDEALACHATSAYKEARSRRLAPAMLSAICAWSKAPPSLPSPYSGPALPARA
jgi:uncharacterized protein (DUF1330 family)